MSRALVDRIADAVLYEGYILYPYRPAIKNHQRWTFGGLYPEAYCQQQTGADASSNQTEILVQGEPATTIAVAIRFLHITARNVAELTPPLAVWPTVREPSFRYVEVLRVGERQFPTWQEAEERTIQLPALTIADLQALGHRATFRFEDRRWLEPIAGETGAIVGVLVRAQQALVGAVELGVVQVAAGLFKLTLQVHNRTQLETEPTARARVMLRTLVATHAICRVAGGEFVSLLDPPAEWQAHATACRNIGAWPVLVGEEGQRDTMLSAPIILYDYPQLAPESPGAFFDGTEIDEMLTLRILTLTAEEKRQMAGVDEQARALLARAEALSNEQRQRLHGTMRLLRPGAEGSDHDQLGSRG